jgi:hypothetical protein
MNAEASGKNVHETSPDILRKGVITGNEPESRMSRDAEHTTVGMGDEFGGGTAELFVLVNILPATTCHVPVHSHTIG